MIDVVDSFVSPFTLSTYVIIPPKKKKNTDISGLILSPAWHFSVLLFHFISKHTYLGNVCYTLTRFSKYWVAKPIWSNHVTFKGSLADVSWDLREWRPLAAKVLLPFVFTFFQVKKEERGLFLTETGDIRDVSSQTGPSALVQCKTSFLFDAKCR